MTVEPIQIKSSVGNLVKLAILALKNSFVHFIPFHNSVEDSQNCFAKMTTPTKKLRVRFSTEDDLNLLRLVLGENPFEDTTRWILIQQTIIGVTNKQFTLRTVKEHVDYLLKLFLKEDKANLKKSGTEEEYQEKQRLLQEISDLKREYFNSSEANNSVSISKQKERGVEIRDSALKNCSEGVSVDHQEEYSTNANSIDELVHVSVSTVLGPTHTRRKRIKECVNPTLKYLKEKAAVDAEYKDKQLLLEERKLAVEEGKLAVEERKIALQEKLIQQQIEETKQRMEMERIERAAFLKIIEQQQQIVSLSLQHLQRK